MVNVNRLQRWTVTPLFLEQAARVRRFELMDPRFRKQLELFCGDPQCLGWRIAAGDIVACTGCYRYPTREAAVDHVLEICHQRRWPVEVQLALVA